MQKFTKGEDMTVVRGEQAETLNDHFAKTGKYALSEFSDDELEALRSDLGQEDNE